MRVFKWIMTILFMAGLICSCITFCMMNYRFDKGCKEYLKLAGDAPTIERAELYLSKALDYLEKNNKTSGNTGIIFKTPANDLGLWYNQIKDSHTIVKNMIGKDVPQLTKDNCLMKIREVVLDNGDDGTKVTVPAYLSVYPHQILFFLPWLLAGCTILLWFICWEDYDRTTWL